MKRGDTARMPGAPCLDQVQRLSSTDFAHDNAVGAQAQGAAHQVRHAHDTGLCAQADLILRRALQLDGVFQHEHPVARFGDSGQQGIGQGGLATAGASRDKDVQPLAHGIAQQVDLCRCEDAVVRVLLQCNDVPGPLAQGEGRGR